jgi:hypothetical protein
MGTLMTRCLLVCSLAWAGFGLVCGQAGAQEIELSEIGRAALDEPVGEPIGPRTVPGVPPAATKPDEAPAEGNATTEEAGGVEIPRAPRPQLGPKFIRLHLLDGSVISGDLSVSEIEVETAFGKLVVPIDRIRSMTPGLDSYPKVLAEVEGLIQNLGADDYKTREQAHKDLAAKGIRIQKELERFANDENAEIKRHVGEILKEIEAQASESEEFDEEEDAAASQPWIRADTVVTTDFTVVGKVSPKEFEVASKYGPLTIALADVARGERDSGAREAFRRTVTVAGQNIAQRSFKTSGVRVQAGDKITVRAEGNIIMSPWGGNAATGPDGASNYGWYVPNDIPGGALVARIGEKGQIFKVGRQATFVAKSSGVLQFAVGIQPEYANEGYQYPGEYRVKLKVEPK